ncbi:hypothetical protein SMALB_7460 [Streptomyces malaysiensis]|uniref:Uncharacterized protein n=1 Tax=Streptomyces malaysiensis TaxID=92644 RepID=A0A7X5XCC4_STRMQ|nr:hypothetical protein [Streptomyces malaysiensis]
MTRRPPSWRQTEDLRASRSCGREFCPSSCSVRVDADPASSRQCSDNRRPAAVFFRLPTMFPSLCLWRRSSVGDFDAEGTAAVGVGAGQPQDSWREGVRDRVGGHLGDDQEGIVGCAGRHSPTGQGGTHVVSQCAKRLQGAWQRKHTLDTFRWRHFRAGGCAHGRLTHLVPA